MFEAIASVLQLIVQPCYALTDNWWTAILLFTIITKVILFPMSLWCQWNSIVMVKLMPDLFRLKVKYFGDKETIGEKQNELYKEKHYHPMLSLIPLVVQILILFGLVDVIHSITDYGAPGTEFLGMVPFEDGGLSWIMPLLACLSAVAMGFAQNRINPLQKEQTKAEKNMTNGLSIGLSLFLGIFVAAGMAFYWIVSNLSAILIQALCNICIKPKKHIDYDELNETRDEFEALNALDAENKLPWYKPNPLAKREKADYKRFMNIMNKHIVFYSESSGYYKYFRGAIEYLLANSDCTINYVTNDPNDQIFKVAEEHPRIQPYYIGPKKIITAMMKMDADIVCMTLEDLETYYIKRSYVRKDIEYVFFYHHMTSAHLVASDTAVDHYDTILCAGPHQMREIRRKEELAQLPEKNLVEVGYPLLDETMENYRKLDKQQNERPTIVIGPSWQEDNILDSCIDPMLESLLGHGWRIIVRPHPEYLKRYKAKWQALLQRWEHIPEEELVFEQDHSTNTSVYSCDAMITDWSSISCEFSFTTKRPTIFINTKMKVSNPEYEKLGIVPTDITLRDQIGVSMGKEEVPGIDAIVTQMIENPNEWRERITEVLNGYIFNIGASASTAGEYLLSDMLAKQEAKKNA